MKSATARFQMGHLGATPAVLEEISKEEMFQLLERHLCGDWGDVTENDARANELALRHGLRIMSWYQTSCGTRIQIITEADRSATTILLAKEY